jgi:hypothetical protein
MRKFDKIFGWLSLPIALMAAVYALASLLETDINWYKFGFFFLVVIANLRTFIENMDSND